MSNLRLSAIKFFRRKSQLGIAVGILALVQVTIILITASMPRVESEAVKDAVAQLPGTAKWLTINLGDPTKLGQDSFGIEIGSSIKRIEPDAPRHSIVFRPIAEEQAGRYQLAASDQVDQEVELKSGRIPAKCNENSCEVLAINFSSTTPVPTRFTVVGTATFKADSPINTSIDGVTPVLLANGAVSIAKIPEFSGFPGAEQWSVQISESTISQVGLAKYLDNLSNETKKLNTLSGRLVVDGPIGILSETQKQVAVLTNRILSIELTIYLIAIIAMFTVATTSSAANLNSIKVIQRISPNLVSRNKFVFSLAAIASIFGSAIGLVIGAIAYVLLTKSTNFSSVDTKLLIINLVSAIAIIFVGVTSKWKLTATSWLLITLFWAVFIPRANLDPFISLIALVSAALIFVLAKITQKFIRNKFVKNIYLANTNKFVAFGISISLLTSASLLAITYLGSLQRNVVDTAIFGSPLETRVTMAAEAQPMQNNSFADYSKYADGAKVFGVRKVTTTFFKNAANSYPTLLVGVSPDAWKFMPEIKHQTKVDLATSSESLKSGTNDFGPSVTGKQKLEIGVAGLNEHAELGVWVLTDRQESQYLKFNKAGESYVVALPENVSNLIGFQVTELDDYRSRREHAVSEGINALPAPQGVLTISNPMLDSEPINLKKIQDVEYSLINGPFYLNFVETPKEFPALLDPETNSGISDGTLNLNIQADQNLTLKSVGALGQLPTVPMHFALVDDAVLTQYLAATSPQLLHINEVWISGKFSSNIRADKELYGLTVFNQDELMHRNLSPSNANWSTRALVLLITSALILMLLISSFLMVTINKTEQIFAWHASGIKERKLRILLALKIVNLLLLALGSSVATTLILGKYYIEHIAFNINGAIAYPKIIAFFEIKKILAVVAIYIVLNLFTLVIANNKKLLAGDR